MHAIENSAVRIYNYSCKSFWDICLSALDVWRRLKVFCISTFKLSEIGGMDMDRHRISGFAQILYWISVWTFTITT